MSLHNSFNFKHTLKSLRIAQTHEIYIYIERWEKNRFSFQNYFQTCMLLKNYSFLQWTNQMVKLLSMFKKQPLEKIVTFRFFLQKIIHNNFYKSMCSILDTFTIYYEKLRFIWCTGLTRRQLAEVVYSLHQVVLNRREIQLTRPALPYDYACFADDTSLKRNICLMYIQSPGIQSYSEYFLYKWSTRLQSMYLPYFHTPWFTHSQQLTNKSFFYFA